MKRRGFLAGVSTGVVGVAGCVSSGETSSDSTPNESAPFAHPGSIDRSFASNGDYPPDDTPANGIPPDFGDQPSRPQVDVSSFQRLDVNGESVRLAPIDVVHSWYRRGEARFVDARGLDQYVNSHVYGAVLSTAQPESVGGGIDGWPEDARVVTYCGCPHHLSSLRAAGIQKAGFSRVFAIDEGFGEWYEQGYPMAGTTFTSGSRSDVPEWTLEGRVDSRYAGEYAWAAADRQYEAAPIREDGRFTLVLKFSSVTSETPVEVSTPSFSITRPLGELSAGEITAS